MTTKRRRKKKYRWLSQIKRKLLAFITPKNAVSEKQPRRKRKRRTKRRRNFGRSLQERWQSFLMLFKSKKQTPPISVNNQQGLRSIRKKRRRRSKKKAFGARIYLSLLNLGQKALQLSQKLLFFNKRRRRRRRKQYAVYVMGKQKKVN